MVLVESLMNKDSLLKQNKLVLVDMVLALYDQLQDAQATIAIYASAPPAAAGPPMMMAPPPPPPVALLPAPPHAYPDLSADVTRLTEEKTTLTTKVATLEVRLETSNGRNAELGERINQLNQDVISEKVRANYNLSKKEDVDRELHALNEKHELTVVQVKSLEARNAELHTSLAAKETELSDTKKMLEGIRREAEAAKAEAKAAKAEAKAAKAETEAAKAEAEASKEEANKFKERLGNLHSNKLSERDAKIANLEKDLEKVKEELSEERTRFHTQLENARKGRDGDHKRLTDEIKNLMQSRKDSDAAMKTLQESYNRLCQQGIVILDHYHAYRLKSNAEYDLLVDWRKLADGVHPKMDNASKETFRSLAVRTADVVTTEFKPNKSNAKYQQYLQVFAPIEVRGLGLSSK